jgi:hypothetical protein
LPTVHERDRNTRRHPIGDVVNAERAGPIQLGDPLPILRRRWQQRQAVDHTLEADAYASRAASEEENQKDAERGRSRAPRHNDLEAGARPSNHDD